MRLAAIFIPEGVLKYVFGENHKGYTLNLGGKYNYEFTEKNNLASLIEKVPNPYFIEGFWGENLNLVSALVGANGTGKSTILNVFRNNSFCCFIYENNENDGYEIAINTDNINDIVYYSPFLNIQNHNYVNGNFKDISKYELMLEDTEYENIELSAQLELHNSENLKRWIKFRQIPNIESFLNDISLPIFNSIKIKINYIAIKNHDTSNGFRPFFKQFKVIKEAENNSRFDALREETPLKTGEKRKRLFGNSIKLELLMLERVIDKVHNILESSSNKYLDEGYVTNNYTIGSPEFSGIKGLKNAFYWFLDNAFIQLSKESDKILFPVDEIKLLTDLLLSNIPKDNEIENWAEFNVSLDVALEILNAYEKFIISFKDDFSLDRKILLTFQPDKNLSSGEKGMYNLFSSLHDYQFKVDQKILEEYNRYSRREEHNNSYLLLLDEADMGFHPQWKKRFVKSILELITIIFPDKKIQILFTTHDPLTLSDMPKNNVVFLDKDQTTDLTFVLSEDQKDLKRTFGANIHDLLADSFFLQDGFMGEFAEGRIKSVINFITGEKLVNSSSSVNFDWDEINIHKFINTIDEPFIKERLSNLYDEKYLLNDRQALLDKRDEIDSRLNELEDEED